MYISLVPYWIDIDTRGEQLFLYIGHMITLGYIIQEENNQGENQGNKSCELIGEQTREWLGE